MTVLAKVWACWICHHTSLGGVTPWVKPHLTAPPRPDRSHPTGGESTLKDNPAQTRLLLREWWDGKHRCCRQPTCSPRGRIPACTVHAYIPDARAMHQTAQHAFPRPGTVPVRPYGHTPISGCCMHAQASVVNLI